MVGVKFIDENGGGPGVRLQKPHKKCSGSDQRNSPLDC